jgi:hypothetical protein
MIRSFLLTFALFSASLIAVAQREKAEQSIEWFALVNNIKVSDRFTVLAEGQLRYAGSFEPMQFQARTAFTVKVNDHFSYSPIGYVYTWNPVYGVQPATYANNEHRIFEQAQYKHKIGLVHVDYRVRLEQRFLQVHETNNGEVVSKGYTLYMNRLRTRVAAQLPLNHKQMDDKTIFGSFYNELFLDFGGSTIYTDPDQNRFFLGAGYQINNSFSFQGGFLYQMLIKMTGLKQENNYGFQIALTHNFDARRKKN